MPGLDRVIDPITRDYVDDGYGGDVETTSLQPQLHHTLLDRRNQWPPFPGGGNEAHLVERLADETSMNELRGAYEDALRPYVTDGLAEDMVVEVTRDQLNRLAWVASLVDKQYGKIELTPLLAYGAGA